MSFEDSVLPDLLIVCADAPSPDQRSTAHRLLAVELAAKLRNSPTDSEHVAIPHPAFADAVPSGARRGGTAVAQFYAFNRTSWGGVPQVSAGDYGGIVAGVTAEAMPLIADVRAEMGDAFDAERFGFNSDALPGGTFRHQAILHLLDDPDIVLDAAGIWRVQFIGAILSHTATPGVAVSFAIALNGSTVASYSQARSDVDDDVDQLVAFSTDDSLTIPGARTLTLVNTSANDELIVAGSLLRFWKLP